MVQPLHLTAPALFDAGKDDALPRRVRGIAYSGGLVAGRDIVVDLASTRVELPAPMLYQHDDDAVIGNLHAVGKGPTELSIEGDLYSDIDDQARMIAAKAARGHPWQMSIGLFDYTIEERPAGHSYEINGRTFAGPVVVLSGGLVREVSIVALGADSKTNAAFFSELGVTGMAKPAPGGESPDPVLLAAQVADLSTQLTAAQAALATATAEAETLRVDLAKALDTARTQAQAARLTAVRSLFEAMGREFTDAAAAPYIALAEEQFSAIAADLRAAAPKLPEHLMRHAAGGDNAPGAGDGLLLRAVKASQRIN